MDMTKIISQLLIAVYVSAVVVPTVQRIKGWMPNEKAVEILSALVAVTLGVLMPRFYGGLPWIECAWIGFYTLVGAEAIYKLLQDKLKTYDEITATPPAPAPISYITEEPTDDANPEESQ